MVVWTAFTSACHSEGSIFGPKKARTLDTQIRASPIHSLLIDSDFPLSHFSER